MKGRLRKTERRGQVVRAAMRIFARQGFRGATSRSIADAAGISEAMVFKIFPSKRALYRAIIDAKIAEPHDGLFPTGAVGKGDDRAVFSSIASALMERMEKDPTFMRLLLFSALEDQPVAPLFFRARVEKVLGFLASYIRRRVRQRAFRRVHPAFAARLFLGMVSHHMIQIHLFRLPRVRGSRREDEARIITGLFLDGILCRRGRK